VPENLHLSLEMVQQIVNETKAERELSQPEIMRLAIELDVFLREHDSFEKLYSEPTFRQLHAQINKLHNALKVLKRALSAAEQISLRNYLNRLGEEYAETRGPHPNLAVREGVTMFRYRSNERLNEMISCVSQVLEWMNETPAEMEEHLDWWDGTLYMSIKRGRDPDLKKLPVDTHRRRHTEDFIGRQLPRVYERNFQTKYGVSRHPSGPGVRFVLAVLQHAGISNDDNQQFSSETVSTKLPKTSEKDRDIVQHIHIGGRGQKTSGSSSVG
jgi:hypothetical protein